MAVPAGELKSPPTTFLLRAFLIAGMLITGSVNTLAKKAQLQCTVVGLTTSEQFSKPWFQTLVMFTGEATVIFFWLFQEFMARRAQRQQYYYQSIQDDESESLLSPAAETQEEAKSQWSWKTPFLLLLPACCDLLGTTLAGIGLIYVSPSVWQMLRGSIIIFTSILSVVFLKRKLYAFNWLGVSICVVGLAGVGTSALLDDSGSGDFSKVLFGLLFIVGGQFCSATQMVVEELFIKKKNLAPAQVVGFEGMWGMFMMAVIVLPILYHVPGQDHGSYENALDAVAMIEHSGILLAMILLYLFSIAFYNFFGLSVAKALTSVHRTLIDALRTTVVWVVALFIYYAIDKSFGEPWKSHSPLQLAGFVLLLAGTLIYNKVVKIPGLYYPPS